jgi:hypothetical protein
VKNNGRGVGVIVPVGENAGVGVKAGVAEAASVWVASISDTASGVAVWQALISTRQTMRNFFMASLITQTPGEPGVCVI